MDIIKRRYLYFAISLLVIIPGLIALALWGLPLAIDFTGGSVLEVQFETGKAPQPAAVIALYDQLGVRDSQVQSSQNDVLVIRSKEIDEATKNKIVSQMTTQFSSKVTINSFDTVGPEIGSETTTGAAWAVVAASAFILLYIWYAFRNIPNAHRYGVAAIIATIHDILVVMGTYALLGHFLGWEVDSLFLTALLTVIAFSVHDDVVVFDRIRENANTYRRVKYDQVVNFSIVQTMDRSINTQFTVMLTLLSLAMFGGLTIRHFIITLLIGVFSGTYSSVFNAAPILVVWQNQEWKTWFRRTEPKPAE
jgi:preprotein translocase subunit SecF